MAKYRNRSGTILEISSLKDEPYTDWTTDDNFYKVRRRIQGYWLPFLYEEVENHTAPQNAPPLIKAIWDRKRSWSYYPEKYREYGEIFRQAKAESDSDSLVNNIWNRAKNRYATPSGAHVTSDFWHLLSDAASFFFPMKMSSYDSNCGTYCQPNRRENGLKARQEIINTIHQLEEYYAYDPELERQQQERKRMQEFENSRVKELDAHIQQLNKNLEVSQQQNSRLQQNVDYLNREQNRIINETRNSFQQQANKLAEFGKQTQSSITRLSQESQSAFNRTQEDTSRAFNQFQKTVEENLRKRGEDYDRNLENFRTSAENELSNIKQNHGVLMEKLRNRMKRRMLSDAPEMKASYNFFADIFAGNK